MEEVTKKVAPGKIKKKNAIKSGQIVLFSSKTAAKRLNSSTVACKEPLHVQRRLFNTEDSLIGRFLGPKKTRINRNPSY